MFVSNCSFSGILDVLGFNTESTFTSLSEFSVVVELASEGLQQRLEFTVVFLGNVLQSDGGGGLLANKLSESCLALNEAERNVHSSAELWEPEDQFNWVNVVSDDDESSLLLFNQVGDVVETEFQNSRLWAGFLLALLALVYSSKTELLNIEINHVFTIDLSGGSGEESFLLLSLSFWLVVLEESEEGGSCEKRIKGISFLKMRS